MIKTFFQVNSKKKVFIRQLVLKYFKTVYLYKILKNCNLQNYAMTVNLKSTQYKLQKTSIQDFPQE